MNESASRPLGASKTCWMLISFSIFFSMLRAAG